MKAYLLYKKTNSNFSYQVYSYLKNYLLSIGDEISSSIDEADYVITFYCEEDSSILSSVDKKKVKILALLDSFSYSYYSHKLFLSQGVVNCLSNVSEVLVFSTLDKQLLIKNNITSKITVIPVLYNNFNNNLSGIEKVAFRRFFQVDIDKKLIVSFGSYLDNKDYLLFDALIRNTADCQFIYIGENYQELKKKSLQERLNNPSNIININSLPQELYSSMIYSIDAVLITSKVISYPTVLFDFISNNKEIILNDNFNMKDVFNSSNCKIGHNYESIFHLIKDVEVKNKY